MAKEEQDNPEQKTEEQTEEKAVEKKSSGDSTGIGLVTWIILAVVIMICAAAGFGLGRVIAGPASTIEPQTADQQSQEKEKANQAKTDEEAKIDPLANLAASEDGSGDSWYYKDLKPFLANLNEPDATRYIRVSIILEMNPELDEIKGTEYIKQKEPIITNWITIYLGSLNIDNTRGEKNQRRIQAYVLDKMNQKLFPDSKPLISRILFREFSIQ